jgi:hypothetical protein
MRNFQEFRDVTPTITGTLPIEAISAVAQKIYQLEEQYVNSLDEDGVSQGLSDLADATVILTGNTPYKIYVFTLTTTFATGTYAFTFVESAPNVEGMS